MAIILHIDPDAAYRRRLRQLFEKEQFSVKGCDSVAEAAGVLETEDCFCALVDVNLKDVPWQEGLTRLRKISHRVSIILTTDDNSKEVESQARIEGVTYFHVKTFSEEEILNAVREIFKARQKGSEGKMKTGQKKILVVDDDPDFQEAIRLILENAKYKVVQAFNKDDGKKMVVQESPDLIILDIMMESTTAGFQFLYEVIGNKDQRKTNIPVLSITSISKETGFNFSPSNDEDFFPADGFLSKPVKPEELLSRVASLLEKKS